MDRAISFNLALLALISGLTAVISLPVLLPDLCLWPGFLLSVLFLLIYGHFKKPGVLYACLLVLGACWSIWYGNFLWQNRLPENLSGTDWQVEGVLISIPEKTEYGFRFDFLVTDILQNPVSKQSIPAQTFNSGKVRLNYYPNKGKALRVQAGQTWRFWLRLKPPKGLVNFHGFDYEGWLIRQGYHATGYVRNHSDNKLLNENKELPFFYRVRSFFDWQRMFARQWVQTHIDAAAQSVFSALVMGDKNQFTKNDWDLLQHTGTVHLMVVSGLHIGLMAWLGYGLCSLLSRVLYLPLWLLPAQVWGACGGMLFSVYYAGLSGFSLPTQRALIMVACGLCGLLLRKQMKTSSIFLLSMGAVLLWDPLSIFSASFWLSFGAVGFLLFMFLDRFSVRKHYLKTLLITQLGISIGLFSLLGFWMGTVPLVMPLANLLAVPWVSFVVMPFILISVLIFIVAPLWGGSIIFVCEQSILMLWRWLDFSNHFNKLIPVAMPDSFAWLVLLLAVMGILVLLAPFQIWGGRLKQIGLSILLLLPVFFPRHYDIPTGEFVLTQLDVGQGLSTIIETSQHVVVYDVGAHFSDQFDIGRDVTANYLMRRGYSTVDVLIISHGDKDHAGGLNGFLSLISAKQIFAGDGKAISPIPSMSCQEGQVFVLDGVTFEVLSPPSGIRMAKSNNRSCVLSIRTEQNGVLLTGDIHADQEHWLVSRYGRHLRSRLLMAAHHGSKSSSSEVFIRTVQPEKVLISAGYQNRYGHPHSVVMKRFLDQGASVFRSDYHGALRFSSTDDFKEVFAAREESPRFWHRW